MGVSPTSVRMAAAASLCVGALLTASAPALATPSNDDTILPAEQKIVPAEPKAADTTVKPASDLQGLLDSLSQTFNDTIGRQLNAARDTVVQQQATNVATSIAVPIANGAAGTVPAVAGSAASALVFTLLSQNVGSAAQSAASTASFASLPAFSVPTMAAWSAPALPAVGLPQLPTLPAFGLPALPGVGLPQMPAFGPPALPESPSFGPLRCRNCRRSDCLRCRAWASTSRVPVSRSRRSDCPAFTSASEVRVAVFRSSSSEPSSF